MMCFTVSESFASSTGTTNSSPSCDDNLTVAMRGAARAALSSTEGSRSALDFAADAATAARPVPPRGAHTQNVDGAAHSSFVAVETLLITDAWPGQWCPAYKPLLRV